MSRAHADATVRVLTAHAPPAREFTQTGAEEEALRRCNSQDRPRLEQLLRSILPLLDERDVRDLRCAAGLSGCVLMQPDVCQLLTPAYGIRSEREAENRVMNIMWTVANRHQFPGRYGWSWLRDLLTYHLEPVRSQHVGNQRKLGANPTSVVPVPPASPSQEARPLDSLIEQCTDDADLARMRNLDRAIPTLAIGQQRSFRACYNTDNRVPHRMNDGQLVEHFRATNVGDARRKLQALWDQLHRNGLQPEISEGWFLAAIQRIVSPGRRPKPTTPGKPTPAPPAPPPDNGGCPGARKADGGGSPEPPPPDPAPAFDGPMEVTRIDWKPFSDVLARRMFDSQREMLIAFIQAVETLQRQSDRDRLYRSFGLLDGSRPLTSEELAQAINSTPKACSVRMQQLFKLMHMKILNPEVTSDALRALVYALHGIIKRGTRNATLPEGPPTDPSPDTRGEVGAPGSGGAPPDRNAGSPATLVADSSPTPPVPPEPDQIKRIGADREILRWVLMLPEKDRVIVVLYHWGLFGFEPWTFRQIGMALGWTKEDVGARYNELMQELRRFLAVRRD